MAPRPVCAFAFALLLATLATQCAAHRRVLAVLDSEDIKSSHSQFLDVLSAGGAEVDVRIVGDNSIKLREYDAFLYDALVLLAPNAAKFGGALSSSAILDFVDSGKSLILAASSDASDTVRGLALEVGVELDDAGTALFDHFNYQTAAGADDASLVATGAVLQSSAVFGAESPSAPVLFRGVAATVPSSSELVMVALSGEGTSYSTDASKALPDPPALPVGAGAALVSLVQARNNARVMVAGSLFMLSDEAFDSSVTLAASGKTYPKSGNAAFARGTTLWTLGERGVLSVSELRHHLASAPGETPSLYRVNDNVVVSLDVMLLEGGKAVPYNTDDLQVSFVMLDPYVRQPMVHAGNGTYSLAFKVPDVYGVFKYVIDYRRPGYSSIDITQVVPVRPYHHDEYERFLLAAYPYYASVLSTMVAFFGLGWLYLYSK